MSGGSGGQLFPPVIAHVDGHDEIIVAGTGKVIGYDPANGKRL
ncbi:MAG: hypothetical protein U0903_05015 [Planctomycetales bacterium]